MDAALPPRAGVTELAPPQFREHLQSLAQRDGKLPPWTRWWPREELDDVIPLDQFDELDRQCPRLPLRYFTGRVASPVGWALATCAYLAFGSTYACEVTFARDQGWPLDTLDGGHLHFMHDPATVADKLLALTAALVR